MFMYFDPMYLIFMIPALILAGIASAKTKGTFKKYSKVAASSHLTGAQAARRMLDLNGLNDVKIHRVRGFLSDHYNPMNRTLNLSPDVHDSQSLSSIGVACHEAGHALQHATGYVPLKFRSAMVPVTQFSSYGAYIFILLGMFMHSIVMAKFGVALFAVGFVFALVTLPVEWTPRPAPSARWLPTALFSLQKRRMPAKCSTPPFLPMSRPPSPRCSPCSII